jgi:putative transcriptional regulator
MAKKTLSQTLIEAAQELGLSKATVAQMKKLNIPEPRRYSPKEIRLLRERTKASQGVFAALLNVATSTVQKWEQGSVKPQNTALRLLNVIEAHGIDILRQ